MFHFLQRPTIATFLLAVIASAAPMPAEAAKNQRTGFAAHYRPGLMQRVARVRGMESVACMVASPHHRIGTWLTVTSHKFKKTLTCRVTDVPRAKDRATLLKRKIVVELDFNSATILCRIKRVRERPPSACPVVVTPGKKP